MHDTKDVDIIIKLIIMSIKGSTGVIKSYYTRGVRISIF